MIINLSQKFTPYNTTFRLPVAHENFVQNYEIQRKYKVNKNEDYTDISQINDRIFIGSELAAANYGTIKKHDISHIINMAADGANNYDHYGVKIVQIHLMDGEFAPVGLFESAANLLNDLIKADTDGILIHCLAGVSRSVTVVLSYLMLHCDMSFYDALKFIEQSRPVASPHPKLVRSIFRDFGDKIKMS